MTVTANTTRNDYTAGSAQSQYDYTFQLNEAADVDVYLDGVKQTLNTHYTVQNVGNASGGKIVFTLVDENGASIDPPEDAVINIVMAMDLDRDTNYQPSGAFLAADVNNDFDRLWLATNQQQTAVNRSLRLQDDDVTTSSMELPLKDARKGKLLAFNATTGDPEATSNNQSNWDTAYNNSITSASFSGSTLTLGQQDGGTITASHTPYLPIAGGTLTGDLNLGFNDLTVGNLTIENAPANATQIVETGTGNFIIKATNLFLQDANNEKYIDCTSNGDVKLYHNNSQKLATTASGISVTGTLSATGYNSGNWDTAYGWGDHSTAGYLTSYTETDPVFNAHVASGITSTNITNWNDAYNNKITAVNYSGSTLTLTQQDGGTLTTTINGGGGASQWTTSGSNIYYNTGNVGIGTSSPTQKLDVAGQIKADDAVHIQGTGYARLEVGGATGAYIDLKTPDSDDHDLRLIHDSSGSVIRSPNSDLSVDVGGSIRLKVKTDGNVGIGTSSPDKLLDLESSTNPTVRLSSSKNGTFTANEVMSSLEFHSADGSGAGAGVRSAIRSLSTNEFGSRTELTFSTTDATTLDVEAMRIDSDGNVGIGTTTPAQPLHVYHATDNQVATFESGDSTSALKIKDNTDEILVQNIGGIQQFVSNNTSSGTDGTRFFHGSNEKMRIDSSGNVGIGTTNPTSKLTLTGTGGNTSGIAFKSSNEQVKAYFTNDNADSDFSITYVGSSSAEVKLKHDGNVILCESAGNVGIGTTTPATTLTVSGSYANGIELNRNGADATASARLFFDSSTSGTAIYNYQGNTLFSTGATAGSSSGTERMRLTSTGNVGIGTSSPSTALDVSGTVTATGLVAGGNTYPTTQGTNGQVIVTDGNGNLSFANQSGGGGDVVDDTTPQLGGDLDVNDKAILFGDANSAETQNIIKLGVGSDMEIYSDGSQGVIQGDVHFNADSVSGSVMGKLFSTTLGATPEEKWVKFILIKASSGASKYYHFRVKGYVNSEAIESHVDYDVYLHVRDDSASTNAYDLDVTGYEVGSGSLQIGMKPTAALNEFYVKVPEDYSAVEIYNLADDTGEDLKDLIATTTTTDPTGITYATPKIHAFNNDTIEFANGTNAAPSITFANDTDTGMFRPSVDTLAFSEGGAERMRINSSGNVGIGTTSIFAKLHVNGNILATSNLSCSAGGVITSAGYQNSPAFAIKSWTSSSTTFYTMLDFRTSGNTIVGSIKSNNTSTQYNTSSDERLKENIQDAVDAGSKIDAIKVRQFDWKANGLHEDYGVIAQELKEVAPEAVSEGYTEDDMMGVDYSKLVPTLIKEIQSLRNRVAELENN